MSVADVIAVAKKVTKKRQNIFKLNFVDPKNFFCFFVSVLNLEYTE
jgi:hypothetical protein